MIDDRRTVELDGMIENDTTFNRFGYKHGKYLGLLSWAYGPIVLAAFGVIAMALFWPIKAGPSGNFQTNLIIAVCLACLVNLIAITPWVFMRWRRALIWDVLQLALIAFGSFVAWGLDRMFLSLA